MHLSIPAQRDWHVFTMTERGRTILALASVVLIVLVTNAQLVAHLSTHVIGRPFEDAFEVLWQLSWARNAVFQQGVSPLFAPQVFYPHGWYPASGAQPIWWMTALAPLTYALGATLTYNIVMLTTLVVGAWGVYLLVQHFSRNFWAGLLAGCAYVFAPVVTMRLGGHLHILLSMQWLPYLALFAHKSVEAPARRRYWLAAGVFLALSILGHWQFLFISPLVLFCVVSFAHVPIRWFQRLGLLVRVGSVALLLLAPFALHTQYARDQMFTEPSTFPVVTQDAFSLSPERLFAPNPLHPWWGAWSRQQFPTQGEGDVVSLSYAALILALMGGIRGPSDKRVYILLVSLSLIMAMGITLHWNGQHVVIPLPSSLADPVRSAEGRLLDSSMLPAANQALIPLPMAFLTRLLPLLSEARVWARYVIVSMLGLAVLAGLGAAWAMRRWQRYGRWIVAAAFLVMVLENLTMPYINFTAVESNTRPIDLWLAQQPKPVTLIEYPLPFASKLAMYRQSLHGQDVVNGYMSVDPTYYSHAMAQLGQWPIQTALPILRDWNVDYVLVNGTNSEKFISEVLPALQSLRGLCLIRDDNEPNEDRHTYLYRIMSGGQPCQSESS